jgi:ABC-type dipeptide/oligopeptide/nickel transport system permease subunit
VQKAEEGRLGFNFRRLSSFFRVLLKNRMSALGLIVLIISVVVALVSTVAFPVNPQSVTAGGQFAQPEWVSYFPEGYYLSKNLVVVNDPIFSAPASVQEWSTSFSDPAQLPYVSLSYAAQTSGPGQGSLRLTSVSSSPITLTVYKTFHYPYAGPPLQFKDLPAAFRVRADGVSPSNPISVRFFIDRLLAGNGRKSYTLWSASITSPGPIGNSTSWLSPRYSVDSLNTQSQLATTMGVTINETSLSIAEVVFPNQGDYQYGFQATFNGPSRLDVSNLGLTLYGSSFGIFGTDAYGNDLYIQDLWGSRISLYVGLISAFIGIGLGLAIGLIAGYKTGFVDEVLMRFTDMMLVIPTLPLLIVLIAVLGQSLNNLILVIGFLGWMGFARVIRSQVLSLKERPFIEAAKAAGSGTGHILTKHIFPNIVSLTYVNLALTVPAAILSEAALSFLGLGDPNVISWGQILHTAELTDATRFWWVILPPGLAIAIVSLSFILIGQGLDEIFNPKLRRRR